MTVGLNWALRNVSSGSRTLIVKVEEDGKSYIEEAECVTTLTNYICTAVFDGEAGGFSTFALGVLPETLGSVGSPGVGASAETADSTTPASQATGLSAPGDAPTPVPTQLPTETPIPALLPTPASPGGLPVPGRSDSHVEMIAIVVVVFLGSGVVFGLYGRGRILRRPFGGSHSWSRLKTSWRFPSLRRSSTSARDPFTR